MSRYEKVDFLMYELQNGFRMALKPFNPPPPLPPLGGGGGDGGGSGRVLSLSSQSSILSFLFSLFKVSLNTLLVECPNSFDLPFLDPFRHLEKAESPVLLSFEW